MPETFEPAVEPDGPVLSSGDGLPLRKMMLLLTSLLVGVVLLFSGINFLLMHRYLEDVRADDSHERLLLIRETLTQMLQFYTDVLHAYAEDEQVRLLVEFDDSQGAMAWSSNVRSALPNAIGAALFTREGQVLGDPIAQRVGAACIHDLQQRIHDHAEHPPPIHRQVLELQHFDLSQPIHAIDGELLGLVMVSFSLDELQATLNRLATAQHAALLLEADSGDVLAASSNWDSLAEAELLSIPIEGANWILQGRSNDAAVSATLPGFAVASACGAVLLIVLMLMFRRILLRHYFHAVDDISNMLRRIQAGEKLDDARLDSRARLLPLSQALKQEIERLGDRHNDLHQASHTDPLTGLGNRRMFDQQLQELLQAPAAAFCLVLLDLDRFKQTNDKYGHACGDLVLKALGQALQTVARKSDLVSRWGGDEFAALLVHMNQEQIESWITRLRHAFEVAQLESADLPADARCQISCGCRCVSPQEQTELDTLLQEADARLYQDKLQRRQTDQP